MIVIADASPLVALATCDCLSILDALFDEVRISKTVYEEVVFANKMGANQLAQYLEDKVYDVQLDFHVIGGDALDKGELSSIALYRHLQADYLLIDEKAGRKVAQINQIKIIGSLGVLIEAKRKGLLAELKPSIEVLRHSKIHFSEALLDYALSVVGE